MSRRVLLIAHNHQAIVPGGVERHTLQLYEAMRASPSFEPILLARAGPPDYPFGPPHHGTPFAAASDDPNQYLFYTDSSDYDSLNGRLTRKISLTKHLRQFLLAHRPEIVHFQHTLRLGYESIRIVKGALPEALVVYSLHDFMPICHRGGQMVRTANDELCTHWSPRRCHECFPEISQQAFFGRERFVKSHLGAVDLFLAPSTFLLERFVEWGLPRERIRLLRHGQAPVRPISSEDRGERNRFAFFGTLNHFKGIQVLLEAVELLGPEFGGHLWIHGASLDLQPQAFRDQIDALLRASKRTVTFSGRYEHSELSRLMAEVDWVVVPSIWWENAPLVIQEAFQHGRPVICGDVGGMAESVEHGINGLHFRTGDPRALADVMLTAVAGNDLWERLASGIPEVPSMEEYLAALGDAYETLTSHEGTPSSERSHASVALAE